MTFSTITTFNQFQSKPLVCMASPLPPSWAVLQRNLLTFWATQGATVVPPTPVSGRGQREQRQHILLACVQVWSDFSHLQCINQCSCPSLASLQWIAVAFRMSAFSVSFIVFSVFFMLSVKPGVCAVLFFSPFQLSWLTSFCLFFVC